MATSLRPICARRRGGDELLPFPAGVCARGRLRRPHGGLQREYRSVVKLKYGVKYVYLGDLDSGYV